MKQIEDHGLHCQFTANSGRDKIVYILAPMQMPTAEVHAWADACNCNIAIIYDMDWDNDLTPWPAPGQPKGSPDFKGLAPEFLKELISETMPTVEKVIGIANPRRSLIGVSLSGLFSLWSWLSTDYFETICSISGSLWYEGFVDWVKSLKVPVKRFPIYLSLGQEEPKSQNKVFATVGACTQGVIDILKHDGINVEFEWNPGNHYAPIAPRLDKCFTFLSNSWK